MNLSYLEKLLRATGCSGYESYVQSIFKEEISKYSDTFVKVDNLGNVIAVQNPASEFKILITGHADEIGLIITKIDEDGFLKFSEIGGIDKKVMPGSRVVINHSIKGVIGKKAIHIDKEKDKALDLKDLYIDIGAKSKEEASAIVSIGDTVNFEPNFEILRNDIFTSKSCDNRVGLYVITEVMRILKEDGRNKLGVYAVSATQEEVGYRGAIVGGYTVNPNVGIAIDVTHATDTPDSDSVHDINLGEGGVLCLSPSTNVKLSNLIKSIAKEKSIPLQIEASGCPYGTDTNVVQTTRSGVATALISIPNRYMHTQVETCSLKDLDSTAKLIAETIMSMNPQSNFLP